MTSNETRIARFLPAAGIQSANILVSGLQTYALQPWYHEQFPHGLNPIPDFLMFHTGDFANAFSIAVLGMVPKIIDVDKKINRNVIDGIVFGLAAGAVVFAESSLNTGFLGKADVSDIPFGIIGGLLGVATTRMCDSIGRKNGNS